MNTTQWGSSLVLPVSADRDHIRGFADAPVTLLEYGDYQCPYCGAAHAVANAVMSQMGEDLRFVFRHFPLTTIHPHAERAAEAAEAAGAQGKFWPMHDTLFENQPRFSDAQLLGYARALGLDLQRFVSELDEHVHLPKVQADLMSGVRSGVQGTPSFFINVRYVDRWDFPLLLAAVQRAAASSEGDTPAPPTPRERTSSATNR